MHCPQQQQEDFSAACDLQTGDDYMEMAPTMDGTQGYFPGSYFYRQRRYQETTTVTTTRAETIITEVETKCDFLNGYHGRFRYGNSAATEVETGRDLGYSYNGRFRNENSADAEVESGHDLAFLNS